MNSKQAENKALLKELYKAYEMEVKVAEELRKHINTIDNFPNLQRQAINQIEISEENAERIADWIEILRGESSPIKHAINHLTSLANERSQEVSRDLIEGLFVNESPYIEEVIDGETQLTIDPENLRINNLIINQ